MGKTFGPDNSAFTIGLTGHADLEPAQWPRLAQALVGFLGEIQTHLPDTEVRLLLDAGNPVSRALAPDIGPLNIPVELVHVTHHAPITETLIRRSSLLLALWDGRQSRLPGDVADQVLRFLDCDDEQHDTAQRLEISTSGHDMDLVTRLVFWVPVARSVDDAADALPPPGYVLAAGDNVLDVAHAMPSSLIRRLADLNSYNREFDQLIAKGRLVRGPSLLPDQPAPDQCALPSWSDAGVLENIDRQFVKADALASYMQRLSDRLFNVFGMAAFTLGLAYLIYDKITESKLLLIFYVIILFASMLAYYFFQTKRWFGKHLSYRALAETLRVRFYLILAGVDRRMHTRELIAITGIYRFSGFGWISFALDGIEASALDEAGTASPHQALRSQLVDQCWIEDQYRYFVRKVAQMEQHRVWIGRLKGGAFSSALIVLSAMFMFGDALNHIDARTGLPFKNVLTFVSGALAVVLGVWELRQNKMAVQELLWQYRNQLSQFQRARQQLQRTRSRGRRAAVLRELGEKSLMEIYLWAIHRYHREHSPPVAP